MNIPRNSRRRKPSGTPDFAFSPVFVACSFCLFFFFFFFFLFSLVSSSSLFCSRCLPIWTTTLLLLVIICRAVAATLATDPSTLVLRKSKRANCWERARLHRYAAQKDTKRQRDRKHTNRSSVVVCLLFGCCLLLLLLLLFLFVCLLLLYKKRILLTESFCFTARFMLECVEDFLLLSRS